MKVNRRRFRNRTKKRKYSTDDRKNEKTEDAEAIDVWEKELCAEETDSVKILPPSRELNVNSISRIFTRRRIMFAAVYILKLYDLQQHIEQTGTYVVNVWNLHTIIHYRRTPSHTC